MRTLRAILALTAFSALCVSASDHAGATNLASLPAAAQANISAALGRDSAEFYARPVSGGFEASGGKLTTRFTPAGVEVRSGSAHWGLALRRYGYGNKLRTVRAVMPQVTKNRVEYRRRTMTEWYVNGPAGLEQGFTIKERPGKANGPLMIALGASGDLTPKVNDGGTSLALLGGGGGELLRYAGLTAYDADGHQLQAALRLRSNELLLQIDDLDARYPVVVDPVVQVAELVASDRQFRDAFGSSIAMSGDVIVVGAPVAGAVYVFVKPTGGWKDMTQTAELAASDGRSGDYFGHSVAYDGGVIVVGAFGANQKQGAAYVFVKPPGGWKNMKETLKLVASDGAPGDYFGGWVSLSSKTLVVGASGATINGNVSQGAAYVFVKPKTAWAHRTHLLEIAKLTASDGGFDSDFGEGTSITGDTVAIGSFHGVYVFVKPEGGWMNMTETAHLKGSDGDLTFLSIATNGDTVVAGEGGFGVTGPVYVFVKPDGGWESMTETAQLGPKGGYSWSFGNSVAIDKTGEVIAVGAPTGNGQKIGMGDVSFTSGHLPVGKPQHSISIDCLDPTARLTTSSVRVSH